MEEKKAIPLMAFVESVKLFGKSVAIKIPRLFYAAVDKEYWQLFIFCKNRLVVITPAKVIESKKKYFLLPKEIGERLIGKRVLILAIPLNLDKSLQECESN